MTNYILYISSRLLTSHKKSEELDRVFDYISVNRKLNYLEKGSHSDIPYIMNQRERFVTCHKREHVTTVKHIGKYFGETRRKSTKLRPDKKKIL